LIRLRSPDDFAPTQAPECAIGAGCTPGESVTRVVRVSQARVQGSAMDELFAARKRVNGPGGVPGLCGAVLHVGGWFVLWQEGPATAVEAALKSSARKRRYDTPRILHRSVGARTLTEPLALSTTQWSEKPELFAQRIECLAAAAPSMRPQDVWRTLSEPCTLTGASQLPPRKPRVGLLASDDQRSIDIARRLAEHFKRPLVYRRFAGADPRTTDVGAAYLDLPLEGGPLRVQAVSRRAFGHSLVHESLRCADSIALLVGDHALKALELAGGVAAFLARAATRPVIELVADSPLVGTTVDEFLREHASAHVTRRDPGLTESQLVSLLLGSAPVPAPA
jgi:hypothetical protein